MSNHVQLIRVLGNAGTFAVEQALEDGFELVQTTVSEDGSVYYLCIKHKVSGELGFNKAVDQFTAAIEEEMK